MKMHHAAFAVFSLSVGIAALAPAVATAEIGVFAAANQDLTGARPSETARPLFIRDRVVANERIASSTDGGGQILFLDQSSLTISPNSDIVLDKYIYDPDSGTGELGITVLKGAMRLVGGRITKTNAAIIRTPTATIGIRGGMGSAVVGDDGVTRYMHIAGISSTISTSSEELTITREGGFAEISATGDIEYLGVAPDEFVDAAYSKRSNGQGDGGGDVSVGQTTEGVGDVEEEVSGDTDATEQAAISTSGEQEEESSDEQTFETASDDAEEESAEGIVDDITLAVDQEIDGLFFTGQFDATITADFNGDGSPGVVASQQDFFLAFSLSRDQGIVLFSLPETGDDLSVDAETRADITAVGLDTVLNRAGASGILESPGLDGFLVSGFPLSGTSAIGEPNINGDTNINFAAEAEIVVEEPDALFIVRDDTGGVTTNESFTGGTIQQVDLFLDTDRSLRGNFDISYDGNPEFQSLDRVEGTVDLPAGVEGEFAADIDGAADSLRDLIELDEFDAGNGNIVPDISAPDIPLSDPNV